MEKIHVEFLYERAVARVTLHDGKGNILDHIMMEELLATLNSFRNEQSLKLIIWEGSGKHFSFGASVEEHQKELAGTMLQSFHKLFYVLKELSIPTLAKISGQCLGGGMELAIMSNFIFADRSARLGQPEIVLGVFPPPASVILSEKIGLARAEELILTGKSISAEEGKSMGLINELFEDRMALDNGVIAFVEKYILPRSASSLRYGVKACRVKFNHILGNFLPALEALYVTDLMNTYDANEGIHSFLEKRDPVWKNN